MTGFSPPPPPQAARAIVRQLFSLRGSSPRVSATALEEYDTHESSIEFLNEGSQADNVRCLVRVDGELEELPIGNLAPETSMVARLRAPLGANFECIWDCLGCEGTYACLEL